MRKRRSFTPEFKREAVRLMDSSGKQPAGLARELGIPRNRLYKWKEQLEKRGTRAFPGRGQRSGQRDELSRVKQELERVKEERDILKKATAYFAKELK